MNRREIYKARTEWLANKSARSRALRERADEWRRMGDYEQCRACLKQADEVMMERPPRHLRLADEGGGND